MAKTKGESGPLKDEARTVGRATCVFPIAREGQQELVSWRRFTKYNHFGRVSGVKADPVVNAANLAFMQGYRIFMSCSFAAGLNVAVTIVALRSYFLHYFQNAHKHWLILAIYLGTADHSTSSEEVFE